MLGCLSLPRVHPRGPVGAYRPTSFPCWNFDPSPIGPRNYAAASSIFSNSVELGRVGGSQSPKLRGVTIRLPSYTSSYSVPCRNEDKALVENSNIGIGNGAADLIGSRKSKELSFSDHVTGLLARSDYRRADSGEEREAIYRLRYTAYLREGAISADFSGTFSDAYDETDNAYLFGLYVDNQLASSLRLSAASREQPDFPSLEVFPEYLQPELDAGKVLIDSTRFVADERLSRLHRGLAYATLRLCMVAAEYFGADYLLAAVRAEHQAFYRRAFDLRVICKSRPYPLLAKPISLMMVHFPSAAEQLYRRYPFFRSSTSERRRLFERRLSQADLDPAVSAKPTAPQAARTFVQIDATGLTGQ